MNDTHRPNDIDPGDPIAELADFELAPSEGFFARLCRRIERRSLGVEFVDLSRTGLFAMFQEFWVMIMSLFPGNQNDGRGDRR